VKVGLLVIAVPLIAAVLLGGVFVYRLSQQPPVTLRIATGSKGGTYYPLGQGLAAVMNQQAGDAIAAEALVSKGSLDNMRRLEEGEVELAFVQNDTESSPGNPQAVRSVMQLYDEVLHVLVRKTRGIARVDDLRTKLKTPLAIGRQGSGTNALVRSLFTHFALGDLNVDETLSASDAIEAFGRGEVDGLCLVSGLKSSAAEALLATGEAELLALGSIEEGSSLDGIRIQYPYVSRAVIPARTYGAEPAGAVGTVAVKAMLVTREDVPAPTIRRAAQTVFRNKVTIARYHTVGARLSEQVDDADLRFPLHEGAQSYYHRDDPPFLVAYAEAISLGLTILVGLGSGLLAFREWLKRAKKNRIDVYYLEVDAVAKQLGDHASTQLLEELKERLLQCRRRAFDELVAERLEANESFTIFQDFLSSELTEIDRRLVRSFRAKGLSDSGLRNAAEL
jgi:TRAP transporter TAXI family solute receptor